MKPGRNNRAAGHNFERSVRLWFRERGWEKCETTRYANRALDDAGVDLVGTEPFQLQCKFTQNKPKYEELLETMPKTGLMSIVAHKVINKGTYIIMDLETFDILIKHLAPGQKE